MNRTDRLVGILLELQARDEVRAEDLAARFEVSTRTVYRDLDALAETGVPLVGTPGRGFQLMDGYFLPPLAFTAEEAALLVLGAEWLSSRVDGNLRVVAETALAKVESVLPAERRAIVDQWRHEMLFAARRKTQDGRLDQLRLAIQDRRVVRIDYYAYRKPGPETRDIEPVQLMYMSERWHLAAFCRLRKGPRMFRLDRIERFNVLPDQFTRGIRHVLPDNYEDWKADADEVRVRFHESIERWVRERQPFTFVREERDERGPIFVYGIRREDDLVRWLLAWGASAEVLSPSRIRARIAAEIFTMYAQYSKNPDIRVSRRSAQAGVEA